MNLLPMNLILLPLLLLLIVIVVRFIVPIIRLKISAFVSWRRSFILAGLYLGILIILVPILYLLPKDGLLIEDRNQAETLSQNAITDLNNHLPLVGDLNKQKGLYENSSHTFKVDTKKLEFNGSDNAINQIFVERKDIDDGEIEVSTYVTTQLFGGIDFTKLVLPPVISCENGTLSFKSANQQKLDFNHFNSDFTVAQFKSLNRGVENGISSSFRQKVVYIRVPKSLEIDKGKYNVQMVSIN